VVTPGNPFLTPATVGQPGLVLEKWEVLVVVSMADAATGIADMRSLSLRARRAVSTAGGRWLETSGPRRSQAETDRNVYVVNEVEFKFDPANL
jgi:hypothetical protein